MLLLHSVYEDTTKGQRSGTVKLAQVIIQVYCRQRLPSSAHHIFPSHIVFYEDESEFTENCNVSTLGLLLPTLTSKASWRMDIFVVEKVTMVITNMCSGWLSVASSVQGYFFVQMYVCLSHKMASFWQRFWLLALLSQVSWQTGV